MAANTVTVGDVTTAGHKVGRVGKGQTPHFLTDATETACTGKAATPADDFNAEVALCKTCAKLFTAATSNTTTEETNTMAETKTETKQTDDEIAAEVKTYIDGLVADEFPKYNKSDADKITALAAQAEKELLRVSANKRAVWRTLIKDAKAAAMERTGKAEVVRHEETTSLDMVPGVQEIIDNTSDTMADGIKAEVDSQEVARQLAENILDARLRIFDKKGRPDLKGTRQTSKDLTGAIKDAAANKLIQAGYKNDRADFDDLMESLQAKITYQMSKVLPDFVRSLDNSPEQFAELFPMYVDKVTEEMTRSAIIFKEYNINPESQAERTARKRREAAALKAGNGAASELTEGENGEGEGEGEGEGSADTSQFEKDKSKLGKMGKDLVSVVGHAGEYTDAQREELRKLITENLTALSDALNKLSGTGE